LEVLSTPHGDSDASLTRRAVTNTIERRLPDATIEATVGSVGGVSAISFDYGRFT
jgi:hypothetical protein